MKHQSLDDDGLADGMCHYGLSRLAFRGPRRRLDGRYLAFVGGTETYGKLLSQPFPALVEQALGEVCVNFGVANASVDAFVHEPSVLAACHDAQVTVVQIMGSQNLSNRFYTVHPRRNDRFVRASTVLQAIYAEVDFSEYTFTRHLLQALYTVSADRFQILRHELQQAWVHRMRTLIAEIGSKVVLLWCADHPLADDDKALRDRPLQSDPLFITRAMVDELCPLVAGLVEVQPAARARGGPAGLLPRSGAHQPEPMGAAAHQEVAAALVPALRRLITA